MEWSQQLFDTKFFPKIRFWKTTHLGYLSERCGTIWPETYQLEVKGQRRPQLSFSDTIWLAKCFRFWPPNRSDSRILWNCWRDRGQSSYISDIWDTVFIAANRYTTISPYTLAIYTSSENIQIIHPVYNIYKLYIRYSNEFELYIRCSNVIKLYIRCSNVFKSYIRNSKVYEVYIEYIKVYKIYTSTPLDCQGTHDSVHKCTSHVSFSTLFLF